MKSSLLDRTFQISLILKGIDGLLEIFGGVLLLAVTPSQIGAVVRALTLHELAEDPTDLIAGALVHSAGALTTSASLLAAVYLLAHGLVKVVLVWAVLSDRLWAFPWMIAFLLLFIALQTYRLWGSFTWALLALTLFDAFVAWLTWHEYRVHRKRRRRLSPNRPSRPPRRL
ncbi:DUF2127 domain-containing protein [Brevibacterium zhoupengii]|uniref:DUF2127 domain-containing protein n=1 Tax=Brevibacterium zhoupengii TaxID=2898795 RepID=UPI001E2E9CBB|nr:DUF2127 domain-containing protein [Brevibacterium zhoupengii]